MSKLKNGIAADLVNELLLTSCKRILTKTCSTSESGEVPSYHCMSAPALLGSQIAELFGLIEGRPSVADIAGYVTAGQDFSGDEDFTLCNERLIVSNDRSFHFRSDLKHADHAVESLAVDFLPLLAALRAYPEETLFFGSWSEIDRADALEAFGLDVPDE